MKKLIIIPAFNEEKSILFLLEKLKAFADYDIVVIDDCSTDTTAALCEKISVKNANLHVIKLVFNLGIGGAVQTGYLYAWKKNYDIAIQMDGDGQHNPEYLPAMVAPIENGEASMVIGSRFIEKKGFQSSEMRRAGIRFFSWFINFLTGKRIKDTTSGYRAVDKTLIKLFALDYPTDYPEPETNERLLRMGYPVKEIPVIMNERKAGISSISLWKSGWYMIKVSVAILIDYMKRDKR